MLISLSAGTLAATAMQHDPLVSNDVIQHLAYRALQSGIDSYLSAVNTTPNLINCNSNNTSSTSTVCPSAELPALNNWETVPGNTFQPVTEYFMWTNPALCFNTACSAPGIDGRSDPRLREGAGLWRGQDRNERLVPELLCEPHCPRTAS